MKRFTLTAMDKNIANRYIYLVPQDMGICRPGLSGSRSIKCYYGGGVCKTHHYHLLANTKMQCQFYSYFNANAKHMNIWVLEE